MISLFALKPYRENALLTQKEIAELFSVTVTHVSNIENGRSPFPLSWAPLVAELFNLDEKKIARDLYDIEFDQFIETIAKHKLTYDEKLKVQELKKISKQRKKEEGSAKWEE